MGPSLKAAFKEAVCSQEKAFPLAVAKNKYLLPKRAVSSRSLAG